MNDITRQIPVALPGGQHMLAEVAVSESASEPVGFEAAFPAASFDGIVGAIEGIASAVGAALDKVKPTKASVEIGLELVLESGQLTALLVKGAGKANLKVTLHWG